MPEQPDWRELETKGFVTIRSFLSERDMTILRDDFARGAPPASYPHGFKLVGREALENAWRQIDPMLRQIRASTELKVDMLTFLTFSHYIVTEYTERTQFWHQDFDVDYKLTQDHINYLNFYVPIVKPQVDKSNVRIIPFDMLRARSPEAYEQFRGSGGHRFISKDGKTLVYGNYGKVIDGDDDRDREGELDFDIEDLALTPFLGAGDLLLMRGDLIHRTQDATTKRTSASIRATYSKKSIARAPVAARASDNVGARDPAAQLDTAILRCFDALGKSSITIEDFVSFSSGARPGAVSSS